MPADAHVAALLSLLDLVEADDVAQALDAALRALVTATGAVGAYVEVDGEGVAAAREVGLGPEAIERARLVVSRGVVAEAVATGRTLVTRAARTDPRFEARESVRSNAIEAVACAPVGRPPRGALYVQKAPGGDGFTDEDVALVERCGRLLWPVVERIGLLKRLEVSSDPTAPWRSRLACEELVGRSEALAAMLREIDQVARTDLSVLLLGPSGTGKSLVARVIHASSPRAAGPFVVIDCPSLPESLFEAELFGAEPGAYTGSARRRDGLVRSARGGTLFLDEVGELSAANQARLLHFLETRKVRRLGSDQAEHVDVRVVSATNRTLEGAREFRADLYWRLAGFPIRVPSLDARASDIPLLVRSFTDAACASLHLERLAVGPGAALAAAARQWPGNLRELQNVVGRAAARAAQEGARQLEIRHLFPDTPGDEPLTFQEHTRRFQAQLLQETLQATRWNVTEAARRLDLSRGHVHALIEAFGLRGRGAEA